MANYSRSINNAQKRTKVSPGPQPVAPIKEITRHFWIGYPRDCRKEAARLDMLDYKIQIINTHHDIDKLRGIHGPIALHFIEPWYMLLDMEKILHGVRYLISTHTALGYRISRIHHTSNGTVAEVPNVQP